jgi:exonuclease VII large subunit
MNRIDDEITVLKQKLNKLLVRLSNLHDETFAEEMKSFETMFTEIMTQSENLKKEYPKEEIQKFHPELKKMTKEIQRKFDNIIEEKQNEIESISTNLKTISNRKKLANYFG